MAQTRRRYRRLVKFAGAGLLAGRAGGPGDATTTSTRPIRTSGFPPLLSADVVRSAGGNGKGQIPLRELGV
jgi:hypothetical protein